MGFRAFATLLSVITSLGDVTLPGKAFGDGFNPDLPALLYSRRLNEACCDPDLTWLDPVFDPGQTYWWEEMCQRTLWKEHYYLSVACSPAERYLLLLIDATKLHLWLRATDSTLYMYPFLEFFLFNTNLRHAVSSWISKSGERLGAWMRIIM